MAKRSEQRFNPSEQEFNPVKPTEAVLSEERAKMETEQPQPEIKTTAAFDNSRLEFLRMTIGPVQNFYQTLGNILHSLSLRVDSLQEQVIKNKVKQGLYEDYLKYTAEQNRIVTLDEFFDYLRIRGENYLKYTAEQNRIVTLDEFFDYLRIRGEKVKKEREDATKTDKS